MARFFSLTRGRTEIDILDLIAERYGWTIQQIMETDADLFIGLAGRALNEKRRSEARAEWLAALPFMYLKWLKFVSFKDFYDSQTRANLDLRPTDQILDEAEQVRREVEGEQGGSVQTGRFDLHRQR